MDKILHTKLGPGLDFDPMEDKTSVSAVASNDLVSLADFWKEKGETERKIAENLASEERYGEAAEFNSRAITLLLCAAELRKRLQG